MSNKYMQRRNPILTYGMGIIGLGVTASAVSSLNSSIQPQIEKGISNVARYAPPIGTIIGAGLTLGALRGLQKTTKQFKRR